MPNKILILDHKGSPYGDPFTPYGKVVYKTFPHKKELSYLNYLFSDAIDNSFFKDVKAIVFTGGADVHPTVYNPKIHLPEKMSANLGRDLREEKIFIEAKRRNIPCVGICRGAQFLFVMCGGDLYTHVDGHTLAGVHEIETDEGYTQKYINVTSTHHQMMRLPKKNISVSVLSKTVFPSHRSEKYYGASGEEVEKPKEEIEVCYFPGHKDSLCVQYHPEYMPKYSDGWEYFQYLLKTYIF